MGSNGYFNTTAKADWGTPTGIEYSRTAAYAYIRRRGLQAEFLKAQGIEVSEDNVKSAWYDFIEKHSADHEAYLYIDFVKEHKKHEKRN